MESIVDIKGKDIEKSCDKLFLDIIILYFFESDSVEVESDVCRICYSNDEIEILISFCLCIGFVKFVYYLCLMSWL